MLRLLKSTFFTLFAYSFLVLGAHAQVANSDVSIKIDPFYPTQNSSITATLETSSVDLDTATISWTVDGKAFKKGTGLKSIQTTTGKSGSATKISAAITGAKGGYFTASATIRPADVSLVWKTDGYIPPFYKGKALATYGSKFAVTAIPEFFTSAGTRINPKTLVYTWKKNGTIDPSQSGYAKDTYHGEQTSYVRGEDEITVQVSTASDDINSGSTISISHGISDVVFYENSPLYGVMYEKALGNRYFMKQEELVLHPVLYDLSIVGSERNKLTLNWFIDGATASGFSNKPELVIRSNKEEGAQSLITIKAQHQERIMQAGEANIQIIQ